MTTTLKTVNPRGVLDGAATNELKNQVMDLLDDNTESVLVDMQDITFMNSTGIGAMVAILKALKAQNKSLYLCGLSDQVKMIFQLTKMDRVFKIYPDRQTLEAAL
ncbi:MAG: STAS domain-containing protein [Leptolyngbya sp. SIOISBB]|nr:STAS domain-containing protein [Leptolyngbya sp. SIOISBB]